MGTDHSYGFQQSSFHLVENPQLLPSCFHRLWERDICQNYPPTIAYERIVFFLELSERELLLCPYPLLLSRPPSALGLGFQVGGRQRLAAASSTPSSYPWLQ